jgi:hypothetical protein
MKLGDQKPIHFLSGVSATDAIHVQQYTNCISNLVNANPSILVKSYVAKPIHMWCVCVCMCVCVFIGYVGL